MISIFFFQAEDGIRDRNVTGVQTCALPISRTAVGRWDYGAAGIEQRNSAPRRPLDRAGQPRRIGPGRSEERRVGKECRSRGAPDDEKKKGRDERPTRAAGQY